MNASNKEITIYSQGEYEVMVEQTTTLDFWIRKKGSRMMMFCFSLPKRASKNKESFALTAMNDYSNLLEAI